MTDLSDPEADRDAEMEPTRLDLRSADVIEPRIETLAELFPEAVKDGKLDVDSLRAALGDVAEQGPERFGLTWPGKGDAIRMAQRRAEGTLVPMKGESIEWETTRNVIIEGENLEVLKLLQRSYHGKVKLIYIDPPYNTGKDFVYPDNFREPLEEYLRYSGQVGENGSRLRANADTGGRYHSAWLSMMWPRLHTARSLLAEDGVMVVSIDDREEGRLILLMDEIFGEENALGHIVWKHTEQSKNDERFFSRHFNSLLLYARNREALPPFRVARTPSHDRAYGNSDKDPRGDWRSGDVRSPSLRPSLRYPVTNPEGIVIDPPTNGWRWSKDTLEAKIRSGEVVFRDQGTRLVRKIYLSEQEGRVPENVWIGEEYGTTRSATAALSALLGGKAPFDTPKPVQLMDRLLELTTTAHDDAIVLDFFAGSGTMGEAVLRRNASDGGRRRLVLVQLDEPLDDLAHPTISALTRARVRAVDADVDTLAQRSAGFRAYRLDTAALRSKPTIEEEQRADRLFLDEINPLRSDEDLLTEVLLARGFDLTEQVVWREVADAKVADVADGALLVCLTREMTNERFEALVNLEPAQLILLEAGFGGNDEVKGQRPPAPQDRERAPPDADRAAGGLSAVGGAVQLQYDPSLPHQMAAIESVVDLFEGALGGATEVALASDAPGTLDLVELGFANPAPHDEAAFDQSLLEQLKAVQTRNGIEPAEKLEGRHFTVEMETGTGKTYVYLRTIFELHARYGLTKFVIAVPTVAIREGVLASLRSTSQHFSQRFATPIDHGVYDSRRLSLVRQFATSTTLQVMVMNIQAFQKDAVQGDTHNAQANVINRPQDAMSGRRPIEYIQAVRPVVVIDEPQNFESENARAAIARLDPLCTLRYSATPRHPYNLVYRLGPVDAFQQGLVKQIEVDGIEIDESFNDAHVKLLRVDPDKNRAQVEINAGRGESAQRVKAWVKRGDDLAVRSRGRPEYRDGHIVEDIVYAEGSEALELTNQTVVSLGASSGNEVPEVQRMQVRETIRYHLDRELKLAPMGLKVLSLFFLDAVADYRVYEPDGSDRLGPIGELFEEELRQALEKPRYAGLELGPIEAVHDAYFSQDTKGRAKDSRGEGELDRSTYEKIMRGKEQLLSAGEPLRFIFTHSALREGWDNPNVFQVCTLTHARSAITRRQQIGRGLRLPVDQHGARIHDREVARLTVIANESYEAFARGLQTDYEEETGQTWGVVERTAFAQVLFVPPDDRSSARAPAEALGPERSASIWEQLQSGGYLDASGKLTPAFDPTAEGASLPMPAGLERCEDGVLLVLERYDRPPVRNARERSEVRFRKNVVLDAGFKAMWDDIARRTRYRVRVDSDRIVRDALKGIEAMDGVPRPLIRADQVDLEVTGAGIAAGEVRGGKVARASAPSALPDILGQLQNETDLTRVTLARILKECGRLDEFRVNPHAFMVQVARVLRSVLGAELVEGIEYEQIDGLVWEMRQLEPDAGAEVERYVDRLYEIQSAEKSPYSHVEWESSVEEKFARRLDGDKRVRFFVKLPSWFTIDTPVGPYNPDWAICWEDEERPRLHLVRETKSTHEEVERRGTRTRRSPAHKSISRRSAPSTGWRPASTTWSAR